MEQDNSVLLKLHIGEELHRQLIAHCDRLDISLEQAVRKILTKEMEAYEDLCEEPVSLDNLEWTALIPYARKLRIGLQFNIYDLVIRLHSARGLTTTKIPGFWHSAFAKWARRNNEFKVIPAKNGNLFERISDVQAPLPKGRKKPTKEPGTLRRYTQSELQDVVRAMALEWRVGESFRVDYLLARVDRARKPHSIGYNFYSRFNLWAHDVGLFVETIGTTPRSKSFYRKSVNTSEQNGEQPK
jgi:hypothetical protein|uniref:Ribbon-helix-helix domain n=1 Tax=Myoviridae sp. ctshb19 TaxID=2825194 RepID=A0A8S5UG58_9CAUD|nr:MAG TPA: Ribbon-helix-helix domain [Myoviridae sp. ctshb19]